MRSHRTIQTVVCASLVAGALAIVPLTAHRDHPQPPHVQTIANQLPVERASFVDKATRDYFRAPPPTTTIAPAPPQPTAPVTPPPPRVIVPARAVSAAPPPRPVRSVTPPAAPARPTGVFVPASAYEACVIRRESGGNPTAVNPSSGASGLYGFLDSTWHSVTGLPGKASNYPPAVQHAAFAKLYAVAGRGPWITDGC